MIDLIGSLNRYTYNTHIYSYVQGVVFKETHQYCTPMGCKVDIVEAMEVSQAIHTT